MREYARTRVYPVNQEWHKEPNLGIYVIFCKRV